MDKEIRKALILTTNHYITLQKEEMFLDYDESHNIVTINWHIYMDRFINMKRVYQIAHYLRKYIDIPIYCAFGKLNV